MGHRRRSFQGGQGLHERFIIHIALNFCLYYSFWLWIYTPRPALYYYICFRILGTIRLDRTCFFNQRLYRYFAAIGAVGSKPLIRVAFPLHSLGVHFCSRPHGTEFALDWYGLAAIEGEGGCLLQFWID